MKTNNRKIKKENNSKNISILYEFALQRGKNRGWYPDEWQLIDYENHILKLK